MDHISRVNSLAFSLRIIFYQLTIIVKQASKFPHFVTKMLELYPISAALLHVLTQMNNEDSIPE